SQVVTRFTRRERLQRWIYHGLHSLDFNFWYYQGWAWTTAMVFLNAGGGVLSGGGVIPASEGGRRSIKGVTRSVGAARTARKAGPNCRRLQRSSFVKNTRQMQHSDYQANETSTDYFLVRTHDARTLADLHEHVPAHG